MSPTATKPDGFNTPNGGFCAWHDFNGDTTLSGGAAASPYGDVAFTNMPYVTDLSVSYGQSFVSSVLDGFSIVGGHEYAETVTDQNPAGGWINCTGGDGATSTATNPSHTYTAAGTYSVTETVTDSGNGTTSSTTLSVSVSATGGTAVANFTFAVNGLTMSFTDTSTDTGGTIGAHSWNFGDGATSPATNPSHTYAVAGTYSVSETVTDSVNGSSNHAYPVH